MPDPSRPKSLFGSSPTRRTRGSTRTALSSSKEKSRPTSSETANAAEHSTQTAGRTRRVKQSSSTKTTPTKPTRYLSPAKPSSRTHHISQSHSRQASSTVYSRSSNDQRARDGRSVNRALPPTTSTSSSNRPYRRSRSHRLSQDRGRLHDHIQSLRAPSLMSLLSSLSKTTHSSSGSNSTVTQASYATAIYQEAIGQSGSVEEAEREQSHVDTVDVFQYLEPDSPTLNEALGWHSEDSSSSSSPSPPPSPHSDDIGGASRASSATQMSHSSCGSPVSKSSQAVADAWHDSDHFLSDSGISMADGRHKLPPSYQPSSIQGSHLGSQGYLREGGEVIYYTNPTQSPYLAYHDSSALLNDGHGPGPCMIRQSSPISPGYLHSSHMQPLRHTTHTIPRKGYDLLASNLSANALTTPTTSSSTPLIPLYRRFETLNHRILLHLQDELQELEDELRCLDDCITAARPESNGPASRRFEQRHGGELHFRRTELLGRVMMKMGQYSQALSAYRDLVAPTRQSIDVMHEKQAKRDALRRYRTWISACKPVAPEEMAFLQHEDDLIAIFASLESSTCQKPYADLRTSFSDLCHAALNLAPHPSPLVLSAVMVCAAGVFVLQLSYLFVDLTTIKMGAVLGVLLGAMALFGGACTSHKQMNDSRGNVRSGCA